MEMSVKEDYKIQSFDPETQNLLKTALKGTAIIRRQLSATTVKYIWILNHIENSLLLLKCISLFSFSYLGFLKLYKEIGMGSCFWKEVSKCLNNRKRHFSEPNSVDLEKVADVIVDQSLKDQVFSKEAGRICYTIVQVHPLIWQ